MNFNRMTIRANAESFAVFKMKSQQFGGHVTDMASKRYSWSVSKAAAAQFKGSYADCVAYIESSGAEFMSGHGIATLEATGE